MLLNSLFDTPNLILVTWFSCLIQIGNNSNKFDKKLSLLQTYLLVACTVQRSLFSPNIVACGTEFQKSNFASCKKNNFAKNKELNIL